MNRFDYICRMLASLGIFLILCFGVNAATYTTVDTQGGKFEMSSTWNGSMPGVFDGSTFVIESDAVVEINGKVYLNGNLNMRNKSKLILNENAILVIDGDLNISDLSDIKVSNYASIYIKHNLKTYNDNNSSTYWYTLFDLWYNANVVVTNQIISTKGADIVIYPYGDYSDVYVLSHGNNRISGNIYKRIWNRYAQKVDNPRQIIDDEATFIHSEGELISVEENMTSILDEEYNYSVVNCTLTVNENESVDIPNGVDIYISKLEIKEGGSFVNNGNIHFVEDCHDKNSSVIDFVFYNSGNENCYKSGDSGKRGMTFVNNGNIYCNNYIHKTISGTNSNNERSLYWTNSGNINCSGDFIMEIPQQNHSFNTLCSSSISAGTIDILCHRELTLDGIYLCNIMITDLTQGGTIINFGTNCSNTDISVMNTLILKHNVMYFNIDGVSTLNGIDASDVDSNVDVQIEGDVYIGNVSNKITITGSSSSSITLCYNETPCGHKTDITSPNQENCGDNYARTSGTVYFRNPLDNENEVDNHAWYSNSPENEYNGKSTDSIGNIVFDVKNLGGAVFIPNKVSYVDCINRQFVKGTLLPIELISFKFKHNEFVWYTASETNNDYFVVEYSKNGKDWTECTEYIRSASSTCYTYIAEPIIDVRQSLFSYFRLKQVDLDGKFSYSDVISTSFSVENSCSDEYIDTRMYIRELGGYYRVVDGKLIYCEGDN